AAGASLCLRDALVPTCSHTYHGSGLDLRFGALDGSFAIAPRVRLLVRDIDPFKPAATLGALARWTRGRFAIWGDPYVRLPLAHHGLGNRASLSLSLWLALQPARGWMIAAHTGLDVDFVVLRDGGHGPLSLAVTSRVTEAAEFALEVGWPHLLGQQFDAK